MADPEHREEEEAPSIGDDKDTETQVAPMVKLQEVVVTTGEEDEVAILYRLIIFIQNQERRSVFESTHEPKFRERGDVLDSNARPSNGLIRRPSLSFLCWETILK
ncbi:hypothetical protein TSUD_363550 [Trifolium subterraneum]|uniref:Uncharacterized protein n=1 Tax=Trifolium subterraneum TaxID=3900 RepID=A0A2Z6MXQ0_TRISU|nr:hypothetical protein TSUD_363550 [Trifolium subterraneum]